MAKNRKTKAQKKQMTYRLSKYNPKREEVRKNRKEVEEFGYLSSEYIGKDLIKTVVISVVIVGLLIIVAQY